MYRVIPLPVTPDPYSPSETEQPARRHGGAVMGSSDTGATTRVLRTLGIVVIVAGLLFAVAGVVTWFVVKDQLADEHITVSEDAEHFGGDAVDGPLTAYAQANVIEKHGLAASDGLTYAQLDQDDPRRDTVMTASF